MADKEMRCPFCGCDCPTMIQQSENGLVKKYYIECVRCGARSRTMMSKKGARRRWEMRVILDEEACAELAHMIWSHWMGYFLNTYNRVPKKKREQWLRQLQTVYAGLSEREKKSDRLVAEGIIMPWLLNQL